MLLLPLSLLAAAGTIPADIPEPSGIDHDRVGGRTFVVDDGGELWVLDDAYDVIDVFDLGGDLEGVDYLPVRDQVLVAVEGDEQLLLVDPDSGDIDDVLDIPRRWRGETIMAAGGNGVEALTVVGPRIFVANQSFDADDEEDGSVLVELRITADAGLVIVDAHRLPILDVAGSLYAARSNELFLLSDSANRVFRLSLDALDDLLDGTDIPAALLRPFAVPGVDQEGICVVQGSLIIAQDSGDLYDAGPLRELLRR